MHSDAFDVIPYEDIKGDWKKLGSGSFGNVYKGSYLGIDVAIKEVLPSNEYDVAKYFEREWRLMKEARHPNVVLYLGLSRAPEPDNRIFIISEFIENGNLRGYIYDKYKPFPWRLRLSFATDIARALAYLHARKCIHRDIKGENLLVTANGRLKITDFGFARIAARNADESKRLTFCGTDSYMSPEILIGDEFDLPTDIFSLGIIFCEIGARKLADDYHFKRSAPTFGIDRKEVETLASPGCPPAFIQLCLDCCAEAPEARPTMRVILERLRDIEAEVLARPSEGNDTHLGSIKFMSTAGGKRPGAAPRIPSFGVGVGKSIRGNASDSGTEDSDDELMEALKGLEPFSLESRMTAESKSAQQPLLNPTSSGFSEYSTTVIRANPRPTSSEHTTASALSSILTIKPSPDPNATANPVLPATPLDNNSTAGSVMTIDSYYTTQPASGIKNPGITYSMLSIDSYHTASSSMISSAAATEGGSTIRNAPMVHRFTLIKPGAKRAAGGVSPPGSSRSPPGRTGTPEPAGWNPLDLFFSSGLLVSKCDICTKRLGWKPVLECDDCGLRAHVKCGEIAPRDCGLRPERLDGHVQTALHSVSPLSKVKQTAKSAASPR